MQIRMANIQTWLCLVAVCWMACSRAVETVESEFHQTVRARAFVELGDLESAHEILEQMAHRSPNARGWTNVGLVRWRMGRQPDAAEAWQQALELDASDAAALYGRGMWHLAEERRLRATAKRKPGKQIELHAAAEAQGRKALANLQKAAGFEARNAALHRALYEFHIARGDSQRALPALREAERLDPVYAGSAPELFGLGRVRLPLVRRPTSVSRTAPRFFPERLQATCSGVVAFLLNGDTEEDLLCLGSGNAWYKERIHEPEKVSWKEQNIFRRPILKSLPVFLDRTPKADLLALVPPPTGRPTRTKLEVWLFRSGTDSLEAERLWRLHHDILDWALIDFDSDGDQDVLVACDEQPGLRLWVNDGAGAFDFESGQETWPQMPAVGSLTCADVNGDHRQDIVLAEQSGRVRIMLQKSRRESGQFVEAELLGDLTRARGRVVRSADLDDDGRTDVVLGNDEGLWIYRNEGTGRFLSAAAYRESRASWTGAPQRGVSVADIALADLDNDGLMDLLSLHFDTTASLALAAAQTQEDTSPRSASLLPLRPVPESTRMAFWRNEGDCILTEVAAKAHLDVYRTSSTLPAIADFDTDGDLDLALVGDDQRLRLLWNRVEDGHQRQRLILEDPGRSAGALGARVEIYAGGRSYHVVSGPREVSIGVGALRQVDMLRIQWADGTTRNVAHVRIDPDQVLSVKRRVRR